MYYAVGITFTLCCLLIINLIGAIAVSGLWRLISAVLPEMSARGRSRSVFALRVFPAAAALVLSFGFVVPSYLLYEPYVSNEVVSAKMAIIASISIFGSFCALLRLGSSIAATRRLSSDWFKNAERVESLELDLPIYKIEHEFPLIALIGVVRPKIFIASKILDTLTAAEIRAALEHEYAHHAAGDNLKRAFLRVCRDLLIIPIGSELDREWSRITERAADERAARTGRNYSLDLAGALVKIARLAPANEHPALPSGAFLIEPEGIEITSRVRNLLEINPQSAGANFFSSNWVWLGLTAAILFLPAIYPDVFASTHFAIERFVHILQ